MFLLILQLKTRTKNDSELKEALSELTRQEKDYFWEHCCHKFNQCTNSYLKDKHAAGSTGEEEGSLKEVVCTIYLKFFNFFTILLTI